MAPPGPPPYTKEQIHQITSPEEQLRAHAELSSYIARMKREKQERLDNNSQLAPGDNSDASVSSGPPFRSNTATAYAGTYNSNERPQASAYRGGYSNGRGGSYAYHPYQRPPRAAQQFRNKSVTFNNQASKGETPEGKHTPALTPDSTPPVQGFRERSELQTLCSTFTLTGLCTRHGCRYLHDPDKQAVCKRWLFKGECPNGASCPLSHKPSPHNAPTCQHFQEGRCNNDNCRFSHVRINPAAPNCESFGSSGYCEKGAQCSELHAHECPYFSNTGACLYGNKCRLGHVHRASRMRRSARPSPEGQSSSEDRPKEGSSDAAENETWNGGTTQAPHQFTQQVDFVSLNTDE